MSVAVKEKNSEFSLDRFLVPGTVTFYLDAGEYSRNNAFSRIPRSWEKIYHFPDPKI